MGQIAAYVTVPIIVAVLGHLVSRSIAKQNLAKDYFFGLGLGILKERRTEENANMHDWAVQMLQTYSPISFSLAARKELFETRLGQAGDRGGSIVVTPDGTKVVARDGSIVVTPDGTKVVGRDDDGRIRVWDLATGKEVARLGG